MENPISEYKATTIRGYANTLAQTFYTEAKNAGWYNDVHTGEPIFHNQGERLMLMVTELAEAYEGVRTGEKDKHLPQYLSRDVEIADVLIRIFDFCGAEGIPIGEILVAKAQYNRNRPDHKPENRRKPGGKKT